MVASPINPKPISRQTIKLHACKTVTLNLKISHDKQNENLHFIFFLSIQKKKKKINNANNPSVSKKETIH